MKFFLIIALAFNILAAFFLFGFVHREALAQNVWRSFHAERLATALNPGNPTLYFEMAEYYFNHGHYDIGKAERFYTRVIELDPNYKEAYYQRGRIYFIGKRFMKALDDMEAVLAIDNEFKRAYYMYGLINGYMGNMSEAARGFEEFIKRDDFNWAGYNDLAWVHFQTGDYEQTLEVATRGLEHAAGNPWLLNMRGLALMNLDRAAEAHAVFVEAAAAATRLTPADWGRSYPGNNPVIYAEGLTRMQEAINHNLELTKND